MKNILKNRLIFVRDSGTKIPDEMNEDEELKPDQDEQSLWSLHDCKQSLRSDYGVVVVESGGLELSAGRTLNTLSGRSHGAGKRE